MSDEAYQTLYAASTNVKQKTKISAVGKCFGQDSDRYNNTKRVLEDIVGTDIDYYEAITSDDVIRIVNLPDPVNFDVPKKMTFKDDSNIKVVLNKGAQSLLGDQVKGMLTKVELYSSELARMQCSMDYCKAYMSALTTLDRDSLGSYYEKYYTYVESNTSYEGMRPYMDYLYQVKPSNIVMTAAAGKETDSAYVLDTDAIQETVKGFLVTTTADTEAEPDESGTTESEVTEAPATTEETTEEVTTEEVTEEETTEEATEAEPEDSKDLRIEIYNSTTINGLAGRWQERLKKDGYNVINTDTERSYHLKECVIYVTEKGQGEDLLEYFPNAEIKVGKLTKADIRIVLGTNNKEVKK
jgi:anionic cell wall polymer biosynthesis LytR-Cps2A-Psr (LCP) family protein